MAQCARIDTSMGKHGAMHAVLFQSDRCSETLFFSRIAFGCTVASSRATMRALLLVAACLLAAKPVRPFSNGAPTICDPMSPIWGCFGRLHVPSFLTASYLNRESDPFVPRVRAVLVSRGRGRRRVPSVRGLARFMARIRFTAAVAMGAAKGVSARAGYRVQHLARY